MTGESPLRAVVARKNLIDQSPHRRFVEDYVFPWPEAGLVPESGLLPFGAMTCCISAGEQCDPDIHDQDEIAFIYRGFGEVVVGQCVSPVRQGDVVFIPRNVDHIFSNTNPEGIWLSFRCGGP